jgi:hypothetical protein
MRDEECHHWQNCHRSILRPLAARTMAVHTGRALHINMSSWSPRLWLPERRGARAKSKANRCNGVLVHMSGPALRLWLVSRREPGTLIKKKAEQGEARVDFTPRNGADSRRYPLRRFSALDLQRILSQSKNLLEIEWLEE